jgi:hypothetical protein
MEIEKLAYWASFAIPLVLILVSSTTRKLIEGIPWHRRHFYLGIDLTIYFLAACLVNVADLAKDRSNQGTAYIWTSCMIALAIVILFVQAAFHQEWEKDEKSPTGQVFVLCLASNGVGLVLLYAFVRMKLSALL